MAGLINKFSRVFVYNLWKQVDGNEFAIYLHL